ncbi:hypothetical protein [Aeromicrobium stalagmiti]|uniref:hypothetical protein n=1 Tax=Aeromicrobium stalagmiti TaxID=2738988 RepID=UPI001569ABFF|nr:hypothetical protein [Aeromicrobium stalagmiti]NRQ51727.1 hypothetical protein [Aeromicrobium stalagmiti]
MNKTQRLRNTADGFMAALVANGFRGPWRWSHLDWELPFYQAWDTWPPQRRNPNDFPTIKLGGSGSSSQGRELLWQLKRTSPFHAYADEPLTEHPLGVMSREVVPFCGASRSDG